MTIIEKLQMYFQFDFVRRAFVVGILVALCAALLGVILVLKRFSFIGDGLSHVAFGAMAVAGVVGVTNEMVIVMPVTIVCAVILLCSSENSKIKGDAAVALISVSALALGYLVLNVFSSVKSDETAYPNNQIYYRELTVTSSYSSSPDDLEDAFNLIQNNRVKVHGLTTVYPMEKLNEAIADTLSNKIMKAYIKL